MAKSCCVDGCSATDVTYFRFPNSRTICKKWMEAVKLSTKPGHNSRLCSAHFKPEDYSMVRGKVRLKPKVVPSLLQQNIENNVEAQINGNNEEAINRMENISEHNSDDVSESVSNSCEAKEELNGEVEDTAKRKVVKVENNSVENPVKEENVEEEESLSQNEPPQLEERADVEDFLTPYEIRQNRDVAERQNAELMMEGIQWPEGNEGSRRASPEEREESDSDCLVVLECVQVELDPRDLVPFGDDGRIIAEVEESISLLTSSDDDDCMVMEPKIDIVLVSDESSGEECRSKRPSCPLCGCLEGQRRRHKSYKCSRCNCSSKRKRRK